MERSAVSLMAGFLACVFLGALAGFFYAWEKMAASTAHTVAEVEAVPIDLADRQMRRERARMIGRIKGLRLGGSLVYAGIGAATGLVAWAALRGVLWAIG